MPTKKISRIDFEPGPPAVHWDAAAKPGPLPGAPGRPGLGRPGGGPSRTGRQGPQARSAKRRPTSPWTN